MRYVDLPFGAMNAVAALQLLACAASLLCMLRAGQQKGTWRILPIIVPAFLVSFYLTSSTNAYYSEFVPERTTPDYALRTAQLPVWVFLAAAAATIAAAAVSAVLLTRRLRGILTLQSICEGLDELPDGVAYSARNGVPLLVNAKMHEICTAAVGAGMTDYRYLRRRLENGELNGNCRLERREDETLLLLGGEVWDLRERTVQTRFGTVTELLAFDVTDLYRGNEELRQRNARLAAVNERIRAYNKNLNKMVREKEILAAKIRLHDDFGRAVLAIRAYLSQPDGDRNALLPLLKAPVFLIRSDEEPDTSGDPLAALETAAAAIGAEIVYDGALPTVHRDVLTVAIRECLTNAVKHAHGARVTVKNRRAGDGWQTEITNDGAPPQGPIAETGGLKNLRVLAEAGGMEMTVQSAPAFRLTLQYAADE